MATHEEWIPGFRAIWQSETARTYQCPVCLAPVFTQYEGDEDPVIDCRRPDGHLVRWTTIDAAPSDPP
jgi:hypothetical protein